MFFEAPFILFILPTIYSLLARDHRLPDVRRQTLAAIDTV